MNKKRVGGNLQRALDDNQSFNSGAVLKEAFDLTKTTIFSLAGGVFVMFILFIVIASVILTFTTDQVSVEDPNTVLAIFVTQILFTPPLLAALHYMGIRHSVGDKTSVKNLFMFLKKPLPFIVASLITQLFYQLLMGFLPGAAGIIVVFVGNLLFCMVLPLIAEYQLSPFQAIRVSFIAVGKRFGPFLQVYLVMFGLFVLGLFTLGIAFIFVFPFYYNLIGVIYRELFGVSVDDHKPWNGAESEQDTWVA